MATRTNISLVKMNLGIEAISIMIAYFCFKLIGSRENILEVDNVLQEYL